MTNSPDTVSRFLLRLKRGSRKLFGSTFCVALAVCVLSNSNATAQTRTYNGAANNLSAPNAGAAGQAFSRLVTSDYRDGIAAPSGENRSNARAISNMLGQQSSPQPSQRRLTSMVWQWGQFIDHDIALTHGSDEPFPISVSSGDLMAPSVPMFRSEYAPNTGGLVPRQQINSTSSFIDASMVYGSSSSRARALRTMAGGRLKMSTGDLLPYNLDGLANANESGSADAQDLFLAGDPRANEQPGLTAMHTLFVREHNRLAAEISAANPSWSDEQLYQHARRMVAGIVQSVTYHEFLPTTIGTFAPAISQYDSSVDATLSNEFATAAFRFGHTMVTDHLLKMDDRQVLDVVNMKDAFFDPSHISTSEDVDAFLDGLHQQSQNETDLKVVEDLRSMLFGPAGAGGMDLMALNIQRGRDHGLPSYSEVSALFGLAPMRTFDNLTSNAQLATRLGELYEDVNDVDLWIGLLSADRVPGTEFGLLLNEMLAGEFRRLMEGDRFFFAWDEGLSESEKQKINNTRLADVVARNTSLTGLRPNLFVIAVPEPTSLPLLLVGCGGYLSRRRKP